VARFVADARPFLNMPPRSASAVAQKDAAIVFLHGFTGGPSSFDFVAAALGVSPAFAPYLHGHGPDPSVSARTFEEELARLERAICHAVDFSRLRVHLCGYSLGARVALGLLLRMPGKFHSASLIGAHPGLAPDERVARRESDAAWLKTLDAGIDAFLAAWSAQPMFATQVHTPRQRRAQQDNARRVHSAVGLADSLRVLGLAEMPTYDAELHRLPCPVTFLAGNLDHKFSELATRAASQTPFGKCVLASDFGHNLLLEAPEIVAKAISESLSLPVPP
jgi:2-succinyl-6-hydroxy-2,4-cyclohexadiene-1-carboxylate synthase